MIKKNYFLKIKNYINKLMESLTVHNGDNFIFPKVTIMENGELKFEIEKEEPIVETQSKPKKIVLNILVHVQLYKIGSSAS
jgi:hypothetical protein